MKTSLSTTAVILAAAVSALTACATSSPKALEGGSAHELAVANGGATPAAGRRDLMKKLLTHNVRIFLYDGKEAKSSASGVVVGSEVSAGGSGTYVLTSAHNLDTRGMKEPDVRVVIDRPWEEGHGEPMEFSAALMAAGDQNTDLALLKVDGINLDPAPLADPSELVAGDSVVVATAPFGNAVSLSGGLVSYVQWDPKTGAPAILKTDANVGFGASGGGVYSTETGKLLGVVAGYRTAKLQNFEMPLPGETFALPVSTIRAFLEQKGFARLMDHATPAATRSAAR